MIHKSDYNCNNTTIDFNSHSDGSYTLKIIENNATYYQNLVKQQVTVI